MGEVLETAGELKPTERVTDIIAGPHLAVRGREGAIFVRGQEQSVSGIKSCPTAREQLAIVVPRGLCGFPQ